MSFYFYFFLFILLLSLFFFIRSFVLHRKNISARLFSEALREENSGYFEDAVIRYESALTEVKKIPFYSSSLKNLITEKLKVLHTAIEYKNNLHSGR